MDLEINKLNVWIKSFYRKRNGYTRGLPQDANVNQGRLARLYELRAQRASVLSGTQKVVMNASRDELGGKLVIEAHHI